MNDSTWTWFSGSQNFNPPGEYGEKGVSNSMNVPSGRSSAFGWYDSLREEFWVFGGKVFNNYYSACVYHSL